MSQVASCFQVTISHHHALLLRASCRPWPSAAGAAAGGPGEAEHGTVEAEGQEAEKPGELEGLEG